MTEKKKKYLSPEIQVVEMSAADIICTSGESRTPYLDPDGDEFNF